MNLHSMPICCLAIAAVAALATAPAQAQTNPAGLDKIAVYNGSWKSTIEHFTTKYGQAHAESTTLKNSCWRSAGFYVCEQNVDGDSKALIVFTYDAAKNIYHTLPILADGSAASRGTLLIDGDTWTYPWTEKGESGTVYFRVVNTFNGPNEIAFRQEYSLDQKTWTLMAKGVEHRLAP